MASHTVDLLSNFIYFKTRRSKFLKNHVEIDLYAETAGRSATTIGTETYKFYNTLGFKLRLHISRNGQVYTLFAKFSNMNWKDKFFFELFFTSTKLGIFEHRFQSDKDDFWRLLAAYPPRHPLEIDIKLFVRPVGRYYYFPHLYVRKELDDFEIVGINGSITLSRAVFAEACPDLCRALDGTAWTSAKKLRYDCLTERSLKVFKEYMYKNLYPYKTSELLHLLYISIFFKMSDLELKCRNKLLSTADETNSWDIIKFAARHRLQKFCMEMVILVVSMASTPESTFLFDMSRDSYDSDFEYVEYDEQYYYY